MHLAAVYTIRANPHDRRRLNTALRRWHHAYAHSLDRARARQWELLRCLTVWTSKEERRVAEAGIWLKGMGLDVVRDGEVIRATWDGVGVEFSAPRPRPSRLVIDGKAVHAFALARVQEQAAAGTWLHSSATMSLVVALEEQLKSWLGLYAAWANGGRKGPKPAFPTAPPGSPQGARRRWEAALPNPPLDSLEAEGLWRAEVTRAAKGRLLPMYFGAATSGVGSQAHMGLLRRDDQRFFALLTLFPQGDPLGEPVQRARNRRDRGEVRSLRAAPDDRPFAPTPRARASVMVPLEFGHGHETLFHHRAVPKSAELVREGNVYRLHVAWEFPVPQRQPLTGAVLALRRGVGALVTGVVLSEKGRELARVRIDGRDLARTLTALYALRAVRQAKGKVLARDRRAARIAEHHLWSAGHQIVDLARRFGAEVALLKSPLREREKPWLRYRHFRKLADVLAFLLPEAGLPAPRERPIYGSPRLCPGCGHNPKADPPPPPAAETPATEAPALAPACCPRCGRERSEYDASILLAVDTIRLAGGPYGSRPRLDAWLQERSARAD